jgi:hypothetical protein
MTSAAPGVQTRSGAVVVLGSAPATSPPAASDPLSAEERWSRWLAKGAVHDRRMRERMRYVTAAIAAGLLVWLAVAIATR